MNEVKTKLKWSVDAVFQCQNNPEVIIKNLQALVEKLGPEHQEELLRLVTISYLTGIYDCRGYLKYFAGPVSKPGLIAVYNKFKPNHDMVFY